MGVGRGREVIEVDQFAELLGQVVHPMMDLGEAIAKPEDHLDSRQVDAEIALEGDDGPDPSDLGRLVPN
jgi:hypothetical protein